MTKSIIENLNIGAYLSLIESQNLERSLAENGGCYDVRIRLVGYYFKHYYCCKNARFERINHIVWLINNVAGSELLESAAFFTHLVDRDAYSKFLSQLESQLPSQDDNSIFLVNMASFVKSRDPDRASTLYKRSLLLNPTDKEVQRKLKRVEEQRDMLISNRDSFDTEPEEDYFNPRNFNCSGDGGS